MVLPFDTDATISHDAFVQIFHFYQFQEYNSDGTKVANLHSNLRYRQMGYFLNILLTIRRTANLRQRGGFFIAHFL
jgi:hypothetical protein